MTVDQRQSRQRPLIVRWLVSVSLLVLITTWLDWQTIAHQIAQISAVAVVAALSVTVLQIVVSAWRWQYTAGRLGLLLPIREAVREYYLATFLNQILPGGVLGDVGRAWRHGRASRAVLASANAVLIERLSGQIMLTFLTLVLLALFWPFSGTTAIAPHGDQRASLWVWPVLCGAVALIVWMAVRQRQPLLRYLARLRGDLDKTLLGWPAAAVQALSSSLIVGSYLLVFLLLASGLDMLAVGEASGLRWTTLLPLAAGLLAAMAWPVTVAGWGVREGTAALLWSAAGLAPEQGVALSVAYGLLILVSSLPGAVLLVGRPGLRNRP